MILLLLVTSIPLAAQTVPQSDMSDYYVTSLVISQIAIGDYGYKVTYLNGRGKLHTAFIPHSWFQKAAGMGELIETWDSAAPFMQVYYKNGVFDHVRLFVIPTYNNVTWTVLTDDEDVESNFQAQDLVIDYN